jgi:hypothetical protein
LGVFFKSLTPPENAHAQTFRTIRMQEHMLQITPLLGTVLGSQNATKTGFTKSGRRSAASHLGVTSDYWKRGTKNNKNILKKCFFAVPKSDTKRDPKNGVAN